ncbi:hypothetical protein ACPDHL_01860 [Myroides sp. C15-4]|uniref:hypothetical protein n=1 Tax=Myroides sp. C15-4 TaxID=3400532 RepID=UPI003D2F97C4
MEKLKLTELKKFEEISNEEALTLYGQGVVVESTHDDYSDHSDISTHSDLSEYSDSSDYND